MKSKIYIFFNLKKYQMGKKLISFLALAILVSSCGNRLSIVKRHYTKGFYVQNGRKSGHTILPKPEKENKQIKKTQPVVVGFLSDEKRRDVDFLASTKTNSHVKSEKKNSFQSQLKKHKPEVDQNIIIAKKISEKNHALFPEKVKKKNAKSNSGDTDIVILVILSLFPFINLIAMYLHDGKGITLNFWIDLILDCLFFLPGIIFALLVVFDIINLA